ncbi:MAG: hypothetical protein KUG83_09235 [Gammaproteobacteria bacterium]|nr:hypothetical protein [Gammaproteobacteria bacterium]
MSLQYSAALLAICALALFLVALFMLLRRNWVFIWLKASTGLFALLVSGVIALLAINLFAFHSLTMDKQLATLDFESLADQHYRVTILEGDEQIRELELYGDMWQIDARIIKWQGWVSALGVMPGYQLGRLQGRYLSIDQELTAPRSVYDLRAENIMGVDLWYLLNQQQIWMPWLDARYGSATFVPMADGARYTLSLSHSGLLARPANKDAKAAVSRWAR